jgi:hypothetical protein
LLVQRADGRNLLEGTDENYHSLGVNWPANRYLFITLSGTPDPDGARLALQI